MRVPLNEREPLETPANSYCVSGSRLIVERSVADAFAQKVRDKLARAVVGDPLDEATQIGAITTDALSASRANRKKWSRSVRTVVVLFVVVEKEAKLVVARELEAAPLARARRRTPCTPRTPRASR